MDVEIYPVSGINSFGCERVEQSLVGRCRLEVDYHCLLETVPLEGAYSVRIDDLKLPSEAKKVINRPVLDLYVPEVLVHELCRELCHNLVSITP